MTPGMLERFDDGYESPTFTITTTEVYKTYFLFLEVVKEAPPNNSGDRRSSGLGSRMRLSSRSWTAGLSTIDIGWRYFYHFRRTNNSVDDIRYEHLVVEHCQSHQAINAMEKKLHELSEGEERIVAGLQAYPKQVDAKDNPCRKGCNFAPTCLGYTCNPAAMCSSSSISSWSI
eukprot:5750865-Pyramimonas_sp.AAC.1